MNIPNYMLICELRGKVRFVYIQSKRRVSHGDVITEYQCCMKDFLYAKKKQRWEFGSILHDEMELTPEEAMADFKYHDDMPEYKRITREDAIQRVKELRREYDKESQNVLP